MQMVHYYNNIPHSTKYIAPFKITILKAKLSLEKVWNGNNLNF